MRRYALAAAAFVLLVGCSASVSVGTDAPSGEASAGSSASAPAPSGGATPGASASAGSEASAAPSVGPGFTLVSQNLAEPGRGGFSAVGGLDAVVAAATYTIVSDDDYDVGMVFSTDGGMTWTRGGVITQPALQILSSLMVTEKGVVMVGHSSVKKGDSFVNEALIVAAPAPDYVPEVVDNPPEFAGNVSLISVFKDGTDWVIIGSTDKADRKNIEESNDFPTVWRSADEGSTWSANVLSIPGSQDTPLSSFTLGPDGSWNLFGESYPGSGDQQFNAAWLRSTDSGASFELMYPKAFAGIHDQGARRGVFSASGAIAIDGWDEVTDQGDEVSVAWAAGAGEQIQAIGSPELPVEGGTPPGDFVDGLLWDNETLVMWGSADGSYPMPDVQFWAFDGAQFVPTTTLPGDGELVAVSRILTSAGTALAFGTTGPDKEQRNLGIWAGQLGE